jgi:hypothetical protein
MGEVFRDAPQWSRVHQTLVLQGRGGYHAVPFGGRLGIDHGLAAREALAAASHRPIKAGRRSLADGRLETILPDYVPPSVPLNLLIVPERAGIARVQLPADFLTEQIRSIQGIEQGRPPSSPIPRPRSCNGPAWRARVYVRCSIRALIPSGVYRQPPVADLADVTAIDSRGWA